jgi:hypothetical protein
VLGSVHDAEDALQEAPLNDEGLISPRTRRGSGWCSPAAGLGVISVLIAIFVLKSEPIPAHAGPESAGDRARPPRRRSRAERSDQFPAYTSKISRKLTSARLAAENDRK